MKNETYELESLMSRLEELFDGRVVFIENRQITIPTSPDNPFAGLEFRVRKYAAPGKTKAEASQRLENLLWDFFKSFPEFDEQLTLFVRTKPKVEKIRENVFWENQEEGEVWIADIRFAIVQIYASGKALENHNYTVPETGEIPGLDMSTNKVGRTQARLTGS